MYKDNFKPGDRVRFKDPKRAEEEHDLTVTDPSGVFTVIKDPYGPSSELDSCYCEGLAFAGRADDGQWWAPAYDLEHVEEEEWPLSK